MTLRNIPVLVATLAVLAAVVAEQPRPTRQTYLDLAIAAYEPAVAACEAHVKKWTEEYEPHYSWGYAPPGGPVWLAGLAASLYELTGEDRYAEDAAELLATQDRFKKYLPDAVRRQRPEYAPGVPTMTDFFDLSTFTHAYLRIRDNSAVTAERRKRIEQSIAESADFMLHYPEWGPMNRAILRAEGLALAAQALPKHEHAPTWRKLAAVLASDSWGRWEEEDASIYHPVWLYSLLRYADIIEDQTLYARLTTRYYFSYFVHLLCPTGMLPEFGDARWNGSWPLYLVCLERGASEYQDPELKWGAQRIFTAMAGDDPAATGSRTALVLTDAYRWANDDIQPVQPSALSEEVLEDAVGRKIVFRNGWQPTSTYLMLNYADEGNFARVPRDFLRHTIPVEEEKMHHGHSDENAICLLMSNGSVLLAEAGYRDIMPSGPYGAYRADYFHNRLVARQQKRGRQQPLYEFLRHSGAYRTVATEKLDFFKFADVDMSRTRITDERTGYAGDRVVVYLKADNIFLVFDIVKILGTGYYTFSTLWHGTTVLGPQEQGAHYYVTAVEQISHYQPPQTEALLISFLQHGIRQDGTFPIKRRQQDETAVYQTSSSHYYAGQVETFVTALVPHARGTDVQPIVSTLQPLEVDQPRAGLGVRVQRGDQVQYICVKTDLMKDILTENVRPRYTFESGRVKYGPIETDASFLYARQIGDKLSYSAANMVQIRFNDQPIFAARPNTYTLQPDDLSTGYGPCKWRYWEDEVTLP
ncbi:MAG: hypothetical protein KKB50_06400 [Planctomycetes bacterium]|nr:hypothetical protein [Planctomycetota bacterium]